MLSKEDLIAKRALETKEVEVPELGDVVYLREMSGTCRDRFEILIGESDLKTTSVRALLVSMHLCDADGNVFDFSDIEREQLGDHLPGKVLDRLFDICRKLSGFDEGKEGN